MSSQLAELETELYSAFREGYNKYIYFLLAAAGAAIAFAVTQTQTAVLSPAKILLAISVASWGVSFFCGCRQILENIYLLKQNCILLRMQASGPRTPQNIQSLKNHVEDQEKKTGKWGNWQFRLLITGACFYIAWHVLEMYLRTIAIADGGVNA